MKIMTYNVYRGGEDRFFYIKEIIKSENPDILAIQEACTWGKTGRFKEVANLLKIPERQSLIAKSNLRSLSGRIYDIAFYSKFPIKHKEIFNNHENVWHSLLHITLKSPAGELHVIIAHLSPKSEDWRIKEIGRINKLLSRYFNSTMILMGDLNSLSHEDPYPDSLNGQLKKYGITKFGDGPRFDVVNKLIKAGWNDTFILNKNTDLQVTVKKESADKDHLNLHLDYIMVNNILLSKIKKVSILDTKKTRIASDHSPVIAEIKD